MGSIIIGILLFVVFVLYAALTAHLAAQAVSMDGGRKKPPTAWTGLRMWMILMAAPLWGPVVWPINRLGYQVPVLGAPFRLGSRRRRAER
jgi:hypothetical protein